MITVAALYVDPLGPYGSIPGVECWDAERNALTYAGPHPVVAHPPCQRWCKLAKFVEAQHGHRVGDDGGTFAAALVSTRTFGGVLEHPAWSLAWPAFGLTPPPAFGWQKTFDGEWVCEVHQSAYGHDARKPTWLLLVGALPGATRWDKPRGRKVVGHFAQRHPGDFNNSRTRAERMRADETHITPPAFAEYLVGLARAVGAAA